MRVMTTMASGTMTQMSMTSSSRLYESDSDWWSVWSGAPVVPPGVALFSTVKFTSRAVYVSSLYVITRPLELMRYNRNNKFNY